MKPNCIIVHYHEIALKGDNRSFFERQLKNSMTIAAAHLGVARIELLRGRIVAHLEPSAKIDEVIAALKKVCGIAYFAPAVLSGQEVDEMAEIAVSLVKGLTFESFCVRARRTQKTFPLTSVEINTRIGAKIQQHVSARVDLKNPEMTVHIEIYDKSALIYCGKIDGMGGLPVGSSSRAVSLLSSGIDSPVASWKLIRRGVRTTFVHFHSAPYTSNASITNTKRLTELLTEYQYRSKLYIVPFLDIQQHITSTAEGKYRVILYRRMMLRIAEKIAKRENAFALVTGDNVGQVASQTLPNMFAINEVTRLPVLRPLAGEDKQDIINLAKRIGTFDVSIEPYDDCCSLFVPKNPETNARVNLVREQEIDLDIDGLIQKALDASEIIHFKFKQGVVTQSS